MERQSQKKYAAMALVGYSVVILCCIFVENDIEVEEESTGKLYPPYSPQFNVYWHISAHAHPIDVLYFDMDILYDFHLSIIYFYRFQFFCSQND